MKVLWFTNNPMPAVDAHFGRESRINGHWMTTLLRELSAVEGMKLAVATAQPGLPDASFTDEDGVDYFVAGQPARMRDFVTREEDLVRCAQIVEAWDPDLVHVHGTERIYGLLGARRMITTPVLVNLQGVHTEILRNCWGSMTLREVVKAHSLRELLRLYGPIPGLWGLRQMARRQMEIIRGSSYFCGQTLWDQAHVWEFNPDGVYFRIGRILRESFYQREWRPNSCRKYRVFFTNARDPLRGTETLIDAIALLKREFPEVSLGLAGGLNLRYGYGKSLASRVKERGLEGHVDFLGWLGTEQIISELLKSHVFAITSWTENESNSLCEAQLLGMPCVASYAGGMPSMVQEGKTGLHFPPGDAGVLAYQLRKVFLDDELARGLGRQARAMALKRHDPQTVADRIMEVYRQVLIKTETYPKAK